MIHSVLFPEVQTASWPGPFALYSLNSPCRIAIFCLHCTGCSWVCVHTAGFYFWDHSQSEMLHEHQSSSQWLWCYAYLKIKKDLHMTIFRNMCVFCTVQCKMSKWPLSAWTQSGLFCWYLCDPVKVCKVIYIFWSNGSWTKFEQNNSPLLPAGQSCTPFLSVSEHRNLRRWGLWTLADHGFVFDSHVWFAQTSLDMFIQYWSQSKCVYSGVLMFVIDWNC